VSASYRFRALVTATKELYCLRLPIQCDRDRVFLAATPVPGAWWRRQRSCQPRWPGDCQIAAMKKRRARS